MNSGAYQDEVVYALEKVSVKSQKLFSALDSRK